MDNFSQTLAKLTVNDTITVKLQHIISPTCFYITRTEDLNELESIQTVLNQVEPLKARISRPQNDLLCAAYVDGVYYRTTIEIVFFNDTARVRLVDFGRVAVVKWSNLSVLEQCMARFPPFAIQCTLSGNLSNYDEAVTERFKEICHRSQCFSVIVKEIIEDCATVTLLAGRNTVDMCSIEYDLRGFIANRNGLSGEYGEQNWDPDVVLQSEGEETFGRDADCMSDAHSPNTKRRIKSRTPSPDISPQSINKPLATLFNRIKSSQRISVILSHWESPAEFYICLKKNEKSMKTLQRQVNESCCKFKDDNPTRRKMWKEENMCCVETSLTGCSKQWYRGQIRKIIKTNFTVFLIDVGTTIRVDSKQICPIKQQIEIVKANAIKCEMANVICPKAEWDSKSNKKIEAIIRGFKDLAASIQIITKGAALPVILWGCTRHFNALAQDQEDWTNLNERISLEDLALLMGDFVPVDDTKTCKSFFDIGQSASFDLVLNTPDDTDEDWTCCFLEPVQYAMNYNVDIVPAWLPSQSLSKSIFNCFVTYVDRHCRIYVLDEYRRWLTRKIKKEINSRVPKESNEPIYTDWVPGQACFAKFKLDHLYYRAEVVRVNRHRQECNVRFIDYFNRQNVKFKDMELADMFGKIPGLVRPYRLANVEPFNQKWTTDVLDHIFVTIVDAFGSIHIPNNTSRNDDEPECSMTFQKTGDFAQYLLNQNMVRSLFHPNTSSNTCPR